MLKQMADPKHSAAAESFVGLSPANRGCAVLRDGAVIAATGDPARWEDAAAALLAAADSAIDASAVHTHVATEAGEAYAVRLGELEMVAVTDRFTLASLVFADMRACLRSIAGAGMASVSGVAA